MSSNNVLEIMRQIPGSWQLPIKDGESVTITFFPNKAFYYKICANSASQKGIQVFTGDDWKGNWHVRSNRTAPSSLEKSSTSSANVMRRLVGKDAPPPKPPAAGPYLVLNFTALPDSILNLNIAGVRVDLANWVNNLFEAFRDGNYRIIEFTKEEMHLEGPKGNREIWHRTSDNFA